jgi:hypothetical protein
MELVVMLLLPLRSLLPLTRSTPPSDSPHEIDAVAPLAGLPRPFSPFACLLVFSAVVVRRSLPLELVTITPPVTKNWWRPPGSFSLNKMELVMLLSCC